MKKLVIFDMDGLLLDTEPIYIQGWLDVFGKRDIAVERDLILQCIGIIGADVEKLFAPYIPKDEKFSDLVSERDERYWTIAKRDGIQIKEGALDLIEELKAMKVEIAIASSTSQDAAKESQRLAKFDPGFDYEVYGDMVPNRKPSPDIFNKVLELAGVKPQDALILEDSTSGVIAANQAGIDCIWIKDIVDLTNKEQLTLVAEYDTLTQAHDFVLSQVK